MRRRPAEKSQKVAEKSQRVAGTDSNEIGIIGSCHLCLSPAAALRVVSFPMAVCSESHEDATDRREFSLSIAERRTEAAKRSSVFSQLFTFFMFGAYRELTRIVACSENGRRCEVSTEG